MDCPNVDALVTYVHDECPPGTLRKHVESCQDCRAYVQLILRVREAYDRPERAMPQEATPE